MRSLIIRAASHSHRAFHDWLSLKELYTLLLHRLIIVLLFCNRVAIFHFLFFFGTINSSLNLLKRRNLRDVDAIQINDHCWRKIMTTIYYSLDFNFKFNKSHKNICQRNSSSLIICLFFFTIQGIDKVMLEIFQLNFILLNFNLQ